jgi:hypothetical protein
MVSSAWGVALSPRIAMAGSPPNPLTEKKITVMTTSIVGIASKSLRMMNVTMRRVLYGEFRIVRMNIRKSMPPKRVAKA